MSEEQSYTLEDVRREVENQREEEDKGARMQLIVFKLGDEEYALPIDQIKEVVITPSIAKVPQTESFIKGVANIRGNIIAIMDLEEKFSLSSSQSKGQMSNYTLVLESDEHKAGILVHEVPNTLSVREKEVDQSSNIIQYSSLDQKCIKGIAKVDDRMIILVDMISLLEGDRVSQIATSIQQ